MKVELMVAAIALIWVSTFIAWLVLASPGHKRAVMVLNLVISLFYVVFGIISGDDEPGLFAFTWYAKAIFLFLLHIAMFWLFMLVDISIVLFGKMKKIS